MLALVGLTAIVGVGLNVLLGLSGQISLGHVAFYAIGAYVVGILTTKTGIGFWIAFPLAGLVAGVAGALLAVPALRVRGPYLAMVTIAFGFIVEQGAAELGWLTGGWNGLIGIPHAEPRRPQVRRARDCRARPAVDGRRLLALRATAVGPMGQSHARGARL